MNGTGERLQYQSWCTRCNGVREHANGWCLSCAREERLVRAGGDVVGVHTHKPRSVGQPTDWPNGPVARDFYVRDPDLWGKIQ